MSRSVLLLETQLYWRPVFMLEIIRCSDWSYCMCIVFDRYCQGTNCADLTIFQEVCFAALEVFSEQEEAN